MPQRQQLALFGCAQLDVLLGARPIADVGKHHAPREAELHGAIELARGHRGHRGMRPGKQLAAKARAKKARDHADILNRHAEHLRHHHAMIHDALRSFVERHMIALPNHYRRVHLNGVVRLDRRDVGLVDLHRRGRKRRIGIAALGDGLALALVIIKAGVELGAALSRTPLSPLRLPLWPAPAFRR